MGDVFEIRSPKKKFNANAVKFDGKYPYVARGSSNNGIRGYINEDEQYLNPAKSLSFGQDTATVFYQPSAYFTGDKIKVMILRNRELNNELAQYFITAIAKSFSTFSWGQSSFNEDVLKSAKIILPVIESEDQNHVYTINDIDYTYMQDRITELEQNRITELEQDRLTELDAYLKATGLDDYELTENDIHTLSAKVTSDEDGTVDGDCGIRKKEFKVVDIFDVKNTHSILQEWVEPGVIPYVTAGAGNNSVAQYVSYNSNQIDPGNCIVIGGKTMVMSYQKDDFFSNDSHNLALYLKNKEHRNKYVYGYLITCLKKSLSCKYSWGDSISNKKIQKDIIFLPVTPSGEPDWDYMEKYIRAMEKIVIADVVKYKDKVIQATKEMISA